MLTRYFSFAVLVAIVSPTQAALLVYEGFNPSSAPSDGTSITGVAGVDSVGFDTATSWTNTSTGAGAASATYVATGLSFSTLPVSGGAARVTAPASPGDGLGNTSRPLDIDVTGTVFGSVLFRLGTSSDAQDVSGLSVASVAGYTGGDAIHGTSHFNVIADKYIGSGTDYGGVRINGDSGSADAYNTGTLTSLDTTYLMIFKMTGLTSAGSPVAQSLTSWILTTTQYDALIADGLTEAELNTPGNVLQTGLASPASDDAIFTSSDFLVLNGAFDTNTIWDEIRISNSSLNEAVGFVATPEPSATLLLILGATGLLRIRRRQK